MGNTSRTLGSAPPRCECHATQDPRVADVLDHSHYLVAGTHGQADKRVPPVGGMDVGSADPDDGAAHQCLTWRWGGALHLFEYDIVHRADDDTTDSAHRAIRFLPQTAV